MSPRTPAPISRTRGTAALAVALVTLLAAGARADDARALLDEAAQRHGLASWRDRSLDVTIESRAGDAVTRVREAEVRERNDPDGGHRTFIEFVGPADVQGTLYLHLTPRGDEEQEWLYVPQARRPRRIAPGQSDETTTGAELGYREIEALTRLAALPPADAQTTLLGDETLDGRACRVVRVEPGDAGVLAYDVWLGADDLLPYKLVPRGGTTTKEVLLSGHETIQGHATPLVVEVVGSDDAGRTVLRLSDVRYDVGLPEAAFSLARLSRGR